jgi:hypothetical protein
MQRVKASNIELLSPDATEFVMQQQSSSKTQISCAGHHARSPQSMFTQSSSAMVDDQKFCFKVCFAVRYAHVLCVKDLRRFSSFNGVFGIINSLGFSRSIRFRALAIFADAFRLAVLANAAPPAILGQKAKKCSRRCNGKCVFRNGVRSEAICTPPTLRKHHQTARHSQRPHPHVVNRPLIIQRYLNQSRCQPVVKRANRTRTQPESDGRQQRSMPHHTWHNMTSAWS